MILLHIFRLTPQTSAMRDQLSVAEPFSQNQPIHRPTNGTPHNERPFHRAGVEVLIMQQGYFLAASMAPGKISYTANVSAQCVAPFLDWVAWGIRAQALTARAITRRPLNAVDNLDIPSPIIYRPRRCCSWIPPATRK